MFCKLAILFAVVACVQANENRKQYDRFDKVRVKHPRPPLKRSMRDSIGNNRMVNTVYRATKNQMLDSYEIRQQQKNQQSNLMNQYSAFFMNQLQSSSGPEAKSSLSEAELKKKLKMAYIRILRQRRKELLQLYG